MRVIIITVVFSIFMSAGFVQANNHTLFDTVINSNQDIASGSNPTASAVTNTANYLLSNWFMGVEIVNQTSGLSDEQVYDIIVALMKWLLALIGFLAVIAFVIAGVLYLTSAGSEDQVARAKRMTMYGFIGTVIALAGAVIIMAVDKMLKGQSF